MSLRKFARGKECQVRIPGVCNRNNETVVWCHINKGGVGGMGMKPPDLCSLIACSSCHDAIDGRACISDIDLPEYILHGMLRTLVLVDKAFVLKKR